MCGAFINNKNISTNPALYGPVLEESNIIKEHQTFELSITKATKLFKCIQHNLQSVALSYAYG